jgi:hypothetical protein
MVKFEVEKLKLLVLLLSNDGIVVRISDSRVTRTLYVFIVATPHCAVAV